MIQQVGGCSLMYTSKIHRVKVTGSLNRMVLNVKDALRSVLMGPEFGNRSSQSQ